jgi:ParB family transcriptional regulator, chromosome partitioning protein
MTARNLAPLPCGTRRRHDRTMRMPWSKSKAEQLELLDDEHAAPRDTDRQPAPLDRAVRSITSSTRATANHDGRPLLVPLDRVDEDPNNPRTEFTDAEIDELAEDIRQHGILQPLVVHPADAAGRYRIHFGAMRYRAAKRARLDEVPVVFRDTPADPYAQVAENQKRHGLTPLDLARFIRARVDEGEPNATIAKRLGMDLTTVACTRRGLEGWSLHVTADALRTWQAAPSAARTGECIDRGRVRDHACRGCRDPC